MGLTHLELEIANPADLTRNERLEFLIDTGALYSVVPSEILERLGIEPYSEQKFILANGDSITRRKGGAVFRYDGHTGSSSVVFGEPGDAVLIGSATLEEIGLAVDPIRRKLLHLPSML